MGAILTKVSPMKVNDNAVDMPTMPTTFDVCTPNKFLDPRSPNPFRTPISEFASNNDARLVSRAQNLTTDDNISTTTTVTPTKLKHKLLRDLGYTLDPRSPAMNFDRTPIIFNDSNISDDFSLAGLSLNESDVRTPAKQSHPEFFFTPVPDIVAESKKLDPRSPSMEIERTPLTLNAVRLDESQQIVEEKEEKEEEEKQDQHHSQCDDHVEDVQTPTKENVDDATVVSGTVKNVIYMDENQEQPMTPNVKSTADHVEKVGKIRTPLGCLMNAQSVDNRNDKRLKTPHGRTILARSIFKDTTTANHNNNSGKMNTNLSSKIPVLRKSLSKEIN